MLKLMLPTGQELLIENLFDEVFSTEDLEGVQYHWNVTKGQRIAEARGEVHIISLSQMGVTMERIRAQYDGMNEVYALTTDGTFTYFRVEFIRRIGSGLIYTPKKSASLSPPSWLLLTDTPTVLPINASWERAIYEEPYDPVTTPKLFGRVEVTLP